MMDEQPPTPSEVAGDAAVTRYSAHADLSAVVAAVRSRRADILARWIERAAEQPWHLGRKDRAVADHIPALLDQLLESLAKDAPRDHGAHSPIERQTVWVEAARHAQMRLAQGLSAGEIVDEFRMLRQEVSRALRHGLDDRERIGDVLAAELVLNDGFDAAIAMAMDTLSDAAEEDKRELLAVAAHDLKTPLTSAKGYLQLLERQLSGGSSKPVDLVQFVGTVLRQVARMQELIDQVMETSQLHAGAFRLRLTRVDLQDLVSDVVSLLGSEARERVRVSVTGSTDTQGEWDGARLRQVLENVLSNAIKYAPSGDIQVTFDDAPHDCLVVTIQDQGIGLSAEDQRQLFERFYRSAEAVRRKIEGTGLGLVIVKAIVGAHGGSFLLESAGRNRGTTATIALPRHPRLEVSAEDEP